MLQFYIVLENLEDKRGRRGKKRKEIHVKIFASHQEASSNQGCILLIQEKVSIISFWCCWLVLLLLVRR